MKRLLILPLLLNGCDLCGSYSVSTGYTLSGEPIDGGYKETCGPNYGTWGSWNLFGDDRAWVWHEPSGKGDLNLNDMIIDMVVTIPLERMVPGEIVSMEALGGYAELVDLAGGSFAVAPLTDGQVEILSDLSDGDDPCTMTGGGTWEGPLYKMRWDLTWYAESGPEVYSYTASGKDKVGFDTFLSASCGGW